MILLVNNYVFFRSQAQTAWTPQLLKRRKNTYFLYFRNLKKIFKEQLDAMTKNVDTTVMTYASLFGASYDTVINGEFCIPEIAVGDIILKDVWVKTATRSVVKS